MHKLAAALAFLALPANAEGFQQTALDQINVDPAAFTGGAFQTGAEPARLTLFCTDCTGTVAIDIQIARSEDGTEDRYRSGETTIEQMEGICKSRAPECTLSAAEVGGAVGWVTTYNLGDGKGSTAVLFQDSDLLTIRSISPDAQTTNANMGAALKDIAPQIVGPKQ